MSSISIPSILEREDAIVKPATKPSSNPTNSAAFIFVHGLADSAAAIESKREGSDKLGRCRVDRSVQMSPTSSNKVESYPT